MKISILGYGSSASYFHLPILKKIENVELHSVIDPIEKNRKQAIEDGFLKKFDIENGLQYLNSTNTNLAIICSPNNFHYNQALALLRKGIHVICEKPMCLSFREVEHLVEVAKANRLILSPFHNRRYDNDFMEILNNISDLGQILQIDFTIENWDLPYQYASENFNQKWRLYDGYGGGMFNDWMPHLIDRLMYLTNFEMPTIINSLKVASHWTDDCDDFSSSQYYWKDKNIISRICVSAINYASNTDKKLERVKILGSKGALYVYGDDESGEIELHVKGNNVQRIPYQNAPSQIKTFYEKIIKSIIEKNTDLMPIPFSETLAIYKVIDLTIKHSTTING